MSVRKRVEEAMGKIIANDPEAALFQICAAIEETSKREGRRPAGKKGYKEFLGHWMPIISGFGLGHMIRGLKIPYSHPKIPASPDGSCKFEDIVYHVVRCGLYHSASLPNDIVFTENELGGGNTSPVGALKLPTRIVTGLIMAIVASPANAAETCDPGYFLEFNGELFFLNQWWGKATDLLDRMVVLEDAQDAASAS
jgi:hypothetical protein